MKSSIPEVLSSLIGLKCCDAKLGCDNYLALKFGDSIKIEEEWGFETKACLWRITDNEKLLCGSGDESSYINDFIKNLIELKLISVQRISNNDIVFVFKEGYEIQLFSQSKDKECFTVIPPNRGKITFSSAGGWLE